MYVRQTLHIIPLTISLERISPQDQHVKFHFKQVTNKATTEQDMDDKIWRRYLACKIIQKAISKNEKGAWGPMVRWSAACKPRFASSMSIRRTSQDSSKA